MVLSWSGMGELLMSSVASHVRDVTDDGHCMIPETSEYTLQHAM